MVDPIAKFNITMETRLENVPPALQDPIKNIIEKENYMKYDVVIRNFNTRANNFLSKLYEVDINGETAECEKNTHIFIKQLVLEKINLLPMADIFTREMFVYTDLSKVFKSLQDQANVPQEDRYRIAKAYDETNTKVIILENLSKKGFMTYEKKEAISIKYAELAVQELAKFHALSFVIEHKMPEYYNNKIKVLKNPFRFDKDWEGLIGNICAHVASLYDGEVKQKIENFVPIFIEKLPKYGNDQITVKCTLTHGDYKKNNVLLRSEDGKPVEIIVIDYQLIDYGCPIRDLLVFIFSGSDQEFRRKHLNYIKELYFEMLSKFLKYFDMDVETVYPREKFEKVFTEWLDYGLMMTLFFSLVIYAPDTGVDFENLTLTEMPYCPDKEYDHIIRGLIDDFIEWGYL